jgi:hypothetical protein
MYGWSEAEALAMNIRDLIPEGRRKEVLASSGNRAGRSSGAVPHATHR